MTEFDGGFEPPIGLEGEFFVELKTPDGMKSLGVGSYEGQVALRKVTTESEADALLLTIPAYKADQKQFQAAKARVKSGEIKTTVFKSIATGNLVYGFQCRCKAMSKERQADAALF